MRPLKITGAFNHLQLNLLEWETQWFRSLFFAHYILTKTFIDLEENSFVSTWYVISTEIIELLCFEHIHDACLHQSIIRFLEILWRELAQSRSNIWPEKMNKFSSEERLLQTEISIFVFEPYKIVWMHRWCSNRKSINALTFIVIDFSHHFLFNEWRQCQQFAWTLNLINRKWYSFPSERKKSLHFN